MNKVEDFELYNIIIKALYTNMERIFNGGLFFKYLWIVE